MLQRGNAVMDAPVLKLNADRLVTRRRSSIVCISTLERGYDKTNCCADFTQTGFLFQPTGVVSQNPRNFPISASPRKFSSKNRHPSSTDKQLERIFNAFKMIHT